MSTPSTLLRRTTVEVGPEEEVQELEENLSSASAYVGYEPSGALHVGHLITAQKLIDLQNAGVDVKVLMADVHAHINGKGSLDSIQETAERMWDQLVAFGLDEDETELVFGSSFQYERSYQQQLHQLQDEVPLNRAKRAMAEIASGETPTVGHVVYPLMQALDIHALDVDIAVGGMEQRKVHMLARDALPDIDAEPPVYIHTPLVDSLVKDHPGKMSSSGAAASRVSASDTPSEVRSKVRGAFCPRERDRNPVLQMYEYLIFPRLDAVTVERDEEYGGDVTYDEYTAFEDALTDGDLHPQDAKDTLAVLVNDMLDPLRPHTQDETGE